LGEFLLIAALEKQGIERGKVNVIYLNPPDAASALAADKIDAWSMWSPAVDIARVEYKAKDVFIEGRDLDFAVDYSSFLTSRDFATKNPVKRGCLHCCKTAWRPTGSGCCGCICAICPSLRKRTIERCLRKK